MEERLEMETLELPIPARLGFRTTYFSESDSRFFRQDSSNRQADRRRPCS